MTISTSLKIQQLTLSIHLGWPDEERQQPQTVWVDIELFFPALPIACRSDNLADTFCYDALIREIREHTATKLFHLIEHLSHEIYHLIKLRFNDEIKVNISLTKRPDISGLVGGVCFRYGDN